MKNNTNEAIAEKIHLEIIRQYGQNCQDIAKLILENEKEQINKYESNG